MWPQRDKRVKLTRILLTESQTMLRYNAMPRFLLTCAAAATIIASRAALAQQRIPVRSLSASTARSLESVADIIELKELPDGRVLVNLPFQLRLVLFD